MMSEGQIASLIVGVILLIPTLIIGCVSSNDKINISRDSIERQFLVETLQADVVKKYDVWVNEGRPINALLYDFDLDDWEENFLTNNNLFNKKVIEGKIHVSAYIFGGASLISFFSFLVFTYLESDSRSRRIKHKENKREIELERLELALEKDREAFNLFKKHLNE